MTEQLLDEFEDDIESLTLIPGHGGVFEVVAGDTLIYSKKETGRHATYEEVRDEFRTLL